MENKPLPNNDLEKLLRRLLQQTDAAPGGDTWAKIAARQKQRNGWLRIRYYLPYAAAAAFLLAVALAGWWQYRQAPAPFASRAAAHPSEITPGMPAVSAGQRPEPNRITPEPNQTPNAPSAPGGSQVNTVPSASVHFQAEAGLEYESPLTGTRVRIPANSLVSAGGRPVRGEVELQFREYRGIPDFLASGVPMHYGDERGDFFFNSGGMFEVRISQGGESLQMAAGESYDVLFSPTDKLTNANLYYFDDATRSWKYQPDPAFNGGSTALPTLVSETEAIRNNTDKSGPECLPEVTDVFGPDRAQAAEAQKPANAAHGLQQGVQTGYELATGKIKMPLWFSKNPGLSNEALLNGLERGLIRMVRDRDRVEQMFPEDVNNVFTELKAFKDCYFIRTGDSTELKTTQKLLAEQYWHAISIFRDKGSSCHITLYGESGFIDFYANLTGSAGNRQFDAVKVMNEYTRLREERQRNVEKLINRLRMFVNTAPVFQPEAEWCKTQVDWLAWFEQNHRLMSKRYGELVKAGYASNDSLALATWNNWRNRLRNLNFDRLDSKTASITGARSLQYALRLSKFGIYNCDQILALARAERDVQYIFAGYVTPEGKRIAPTAFALLERSTRLFLTFAGGDKLVKLPGRQLEILLTGSDGRRYRVPAADYAGTDFNGLNSKVFRVQDITDKASTPREWANLLDL